MTNSPDVVDAPARRRNPRLRRRISLAAQAAVGAVVLALLAWQADWANFADGFLNPEAAVAMFPEAFGALLNTLIYTLSAFGFGLFFGVVMALMRLSSLRLYRWIAAIYIEVFRGLPALLVIFLVGFGLPRAFPDFSFPGGVYGQLAFGLGMTATAYVAETIRAGIQAVPKGQVEAARSLGMSHTQTMIKIVIPQAVRIVIPPMTNEFVLLTKDSALVYVLGVTLATRELTKLGREVTFETASATPLLVAGLLYLAITIPLSQMSRRMERRLDGK